MRNKFLVTCLFLISPAFAEDLLSIVDIQTGEYTCATGIDGKLWCWGDNKYGQLGLGDDRPRLSPAHVQLPAPVADLAKAATFSCVRLIDQSVWCWGSNSEGELGLGDKVDRLLPTQVSLPGPAANLYVGDLSVCAILADGAGWCWGWNSVGESGDLNADPLRPRPYRVNEKLKRFIMGFQGTCAETVSGNFYCSGDNEKGTLGFPHSNEVLVPTLVSFSVPLQDLAIGESHSCAVALGGEVFCWGGNFKGQLGNVGTIPPYTPLQVKALPGPAVSVTVDYLSTCAVLKDGSLWCWGENSYGQFGLAQTNYGLWKPTQIPSARALTRVSIRYEAMCVMDIAGLVKCAGRNNYGQLGYGDTSPKGAAETLDDLPFLEF